MAVHTPRLICKGRYTYDNNEYLNVVEYSGNKIDKQAIVYKDGSVRDIDDDKFIKLTESELQDVVGVKIVFKDVPPKVISYARYQECCQEHPAYIRVSDIKEACNEAAAFSLCDDNDVTGLQMLKQSDYAGYVVDYVGNRDGVVKEDGMGLFGLGGNRSDEEVRNTALAHPDSVKWMYILSLDTQDAKDLGYDHREEWKNLVIANAPDICKAYNISLKNLVIDCGYHSNTDNPHIHLNFYSKDSGEGKLEGGTRAITKASEKLKSTFTNTIFKVESVRLDKEKSATQRLFMENLRQQIADIETTAVNPRILEQLESLSAKLAKLDSGKLKYGWLPAELKLEVDETLRSFVELNPQLKEAFDNYTAVQEAMTLRYVVNPEGLEERVSEWRERFFHPHKQDLKQHHNIIIAAAAELAGHRTAQLRTYEEQSLDSTTPEPELSSEKMDVDATEQLDYSDYFPIPDDEPNDELRTYADKNVYFAPDSPEMSTDLEAYFTKDEFDDFVERSGKVFRDSMRDIFNPKVANTALQIHAKLQLEMLQSKLDAEDDDGCTELRTKIHRLVSSTDTDYLTNFSQLVQDVKEHVAKQWGEDVSKLDSMINTSIETGTSFLLSGIDNYAARLDDERYYQLLYAYKELGDPLNRVIRKELKRCAPESKDVQTVLHNIADAAEFLNDKKCNDYVKTQIKELQDLMRNSEDYNSAIAEYKEAFAGVLNKHMPKGLGGKYTKRFNNTFDGVLRIMRPHYTYIQSARELDNILCDNIMRSDTVQKPLKQLLRSELDACLVDEDSFSAEWSRRELERIRQSDDPEAAARVVAYLYQTSDSFCAKVDNQIGAMYQLQKEVVSPETATKYCEEYKEQLLHGSYLPLHGSIQWYANQLDENCYRVLLRQYKDCTKDLTRDLCKGLWAALEDEQQVTALKRLHNLIDTEEASKKDIDVALHNLYNNIVGEEEIAEHTETIGQSFRNAISGKVDENLALTLYERVRSDIHTGELPSVDFILRSFATEVDTNILKSFLKGQLKSEPVRAFRSELYLAASRTHRQSTPLCMERINLLLEHANDRQNFDDILTLLSPDGGKSLKEAQQELYQSMYKQYTLAINEPMSYDKYKEVMDKAFYGEEGNTFFFQECVASAMADTTLPIPALFVAKQIVKMLVRSVVGAAASTHEHDPSGEHTLSTHKQFHNTRFEQPTQFTQY